MTDPDLRAAFSHVTTWVFDLDNTLYPPDCRLFDLIEVRMTNYVMRALGIGRPEADHLRDRYWRLHGTTLSGLMREHGLDPAPYLADVHDIPLDRLSPDPDLAAAIAALPGRRIVYTNGSAEYAARVAAARGLDGVFDAIYGIEHAQYHPKPDMAAFLAVFRHDAFDPSRAAMFEDDPRNLVVPKALGMRTVLIAETAQPARHIDCHTADLTAFLVRLQGRMPRQPSSSGTVCRLDGDAPPA